MCVFSTDIGTIADPAGARNIKGVTYRDHSLGATVQQQQLFAVMPSLLSTSKFLGSWRAPCRAHGLSGREGEGRRTARGDALREYIPRAFVQNRAVVLSAIPQVTSLALYDRLHSATDSCPSFSHPLERIASMINKAYWMEIRFFFGLDACWFTRTVRIKVAHRLVRDRRTPCRHESLEWLFPAPSGCGLILRVCCAFQCIHHLASHFCSRSLRWRHLHFTPSSFWRGVP